jgi:hypothetical protein
VGAAAQQRLAAKELATLFSVDVLLSFTLIVAAYL